MLPKKQYRVTCRVGSGKPWRYAERGGGAYTQERHARARVKEHLRKGREAKLYVTECNWVELQVDE